MSNTANQSDLSEPLLDSQGFDPERLKRMRNQLQTYVSSQKLAGLVTLLCRDDEVVVETLGHQTFGGPVMQRNTIFRIASMTKPMAAVAALMLVEECKLRLDDPLDELLPELSQMQVLKRLDGPLDDTVPAERTPSLRDLLTMRLGFGSIMLPSKDFPIQQAVTRLGVNGLGAPVKGQHSTSLSPDEWLKRFASLPLMAQPGQQWMYEVSFMLLGVVIARAAGQRLETFMQERLFAPLGMKDTGFSLPDSSLSRLAACYQPGQAGPELHDGIEDSIWRQPPAFPDAAGGLLSTVDDCLAFGQMLLNQGVYQGQRLLSRASVLAMSSDQITPEQKARSPFFPGFWDDKGWGFGACVYTQRADLASSPGRFGWDGGFNSSLYVDPGENLIGILMAQSMDFSLKVVPDFWTLTYQALAD